MVPKISQEEEMLWQKFCDRQQLSPLQVEQFKKYYVLLREANEVHNLTTITDLGFVIQDHFEDSLALRQFIDCHSLTTLADIGTGAGFPALPLKISLSASQAGPYRGESQKTRLLGAGCKGAES